MIKDSQQDMEKELLRVIPVGTDVAQARSVLSKNGFLYIVESPSTLL
jgi:hypothetical protein